MLVLVTLVRTRPRGGNLAALHLSESSGRPGRVQKELAKYLPNASMHEIHSPHGHDSFLIEIHSLNETVARFRQGVNTSAALDQVRAPLPTSHSTLLHAAPTRIVPCCIFLSAGGERRSPRESLGKSCKKLPCQDQRCGMCSFGPSPHSLSKHVVPPPVPRRLI